MRHVPLLTLLLGSGYLSAFGQDAIYQPLNPAPAAGHAVEVPAKLKPGQQLRIDFGNYNRFKYKSAVQTSYFYREFSGAVAPTTPVPVPTATNSLTDPVKRLNLQENIAAADAALVTLTQVATAYQGYHDLVGEVSRLYSQDYWPNDPTSVLIPLANQAFGPGYRSLTAGDFVDQLGQWQQELAQAQADYAAQVAGLASVLPNLKTKLKTAKANLAAPYQKWVSADTAAQRYTRKKEKEKIAKETKKRDTAEQQARRKMQPLLIAKNTAQSNLEEAQQAAEKYTARRADTIHADQVQAEITRWLAREAKNPVLPTLAAAYVALRDAQPGPVLEYLAIPHDKDELDLELKLLLRDDYHAPPGSTLVPAPTPYKTTIFLVPRFRITASVGPYVGWLFDRQYVLADDSVQLAAGTYGKRRRIVRDNADQHFEYVGATVLTHFEYRFAPSWGTALSLGAGVQGAGFRALVGPSLLFGNGQRGILTGGLILGQVKRLSSLYQEEEKIPVTIQTVPTREVNAASWFVALTYNLRSERK